jgi:hypothetical protein
MESGETFHVSFCRRTSEKRQGRKGKRRRKVVNRRQRRRGTEREHDLHLHPPRSETNASTPKESHTRSVNQSLERVSTRSKCTSCVSLQHQYSSLLTKGGSGTYVIMCMFPPLSQQYPRGARTVPAPRTRTSTGWAYSAASPKGAE